jgi:hypothetical protein
MRRCLMSGVSRSSRLTCVVAATALVLVARGAWAVLQELPRRQRVADAVAVLRGLYGDKLNCVDKLRMVQYNIDLTMRQFQTVQGLVEAELRSDSPSVMKVVRYYDTLLELVDHLRQFAPAEHLQAMQQAKASLEEAKKRLEQMPAAKGAEAGPAKPTEKGVGKKPEAAEGSPAGGEAAKPSEEGTTISGTAGVPVATTGKTAPKALSLKEAAEGSASELQRALALLQKHIDALKSKIDSFAATSPVDYEKILRQRIAELDGELIRYESILAARCAEYHALFGQEPPVKISFKGEIERMHAATKKPGLLTVD